VLTLRNAGVWYADPKRGGRSGSLRPVAVWWCYGSAGTSEQATLRRKVRRCCYVQLRCSAATVRVTADRQVKDESRVQLNLTRPRLANQTSNIRPPANNQPLQQKGGRPGDRPGKCLSSAARSQNRLFPGSGRGGDEHSAADTEGKKKGKKKVRVGGGTQQAATEIRKQETAAGCLGAHSVSALNGRKVTKLREGTVLRPKAANNGSFLNRTKHMEQQARWPG